jgi:enoyl-CoA hydratase/carnithine racemase
MDYSKILYAVNDYVATVTINRPHVYNAFDYQTLRELEHAFQTAADDDRIRVLVLTGAGDKAFCTGADLQEQEKFLTRPQDYWKWFGAFQDAHNKLRWMGKPTIARLNGMVVGGGNEFNMSCDLAIAANDITIRQIGNSRGSVAAGGATQWLPIIVGDRRAREILWLNEPISAQKAFEWGLINQVVPRAQLDAAVAAMAEKLANKMPEVFRYTKQQTNFWKEFAWSTTVGHARDWLAVHADSPEVAEGLHAFHAKRPVDYAAMRERQVTDFYKTCSHCGAKDIPVAFEFCGHCGNRFETGNGASTIVTEATVVNNILMQAPEAMQVLEAHGIRICGGCIVLLNGSVRETAEYSGLSATEASALVEELNDKLYGAQNESSTQSTR